MLSIRGQLSHYKNLQADSSSHYPEALKSIFSLEQSRIAKAFIEQWPGYGPTPLYALPALAEDIQVGKIYYKDESRRFGLGSFKALGGAYAVARQIQKRIRDITGEAASIDQLLDGRFSEFTRDMVFSCATAGNHGRSVAWGCQLFGAQCVKYIHRDVSPARENAMRALGAEVIRIEGNYDDSVRQADVDAKKHGRIIVSDTSYPGYMEIPRDVAQGYSVMLSESVRQLEGEIPTHVFIQGGVGGLASAVCAYFWATWGELRPRFIVVEPEKANCLQQSARAGKPVAVEGDLDTLMAGLACGEVSLLAWKILSIGANDFMTVNEEAVAPTMRLLAGGYRGDPQIEAGESAVAGLAALITARNDPQLSASLELDKNSRVYILGSEGATDPERYQQLINA